MKTHLHLDAKPAKVLSDYALFITEQPGLELALDLGTSVVRLASNGLAGSIERADTCCCENEDTVCCSR